MDWEVVRISLSTTHLQKVIQLITAVILLSPVQEQNVPKIIETLPPQFFLPERSIEDLIKGTANYVLSVLMPAVPVNVREIEARKLMQLTYGKPGKYVDILLDGRNAEITEDSRNDEYKWNLSSIAYFSDGQAYSTIPIRNITAITCGLFTIPINTYIINSTLCYKQISMRIKELDADSIYVSQDWRYHFLFNAYINLTSGNIGLYPLINTYAFRRPITKIDTLTLKFAYPFEIKKGNTIKVPITSVTFISSDIITPPVGDPYIAFIGCWVVVAIEYDFQVKAGDIIVFSGIELKRADDVLPYDPFVDKNATEYFTRKEGFVVTMTDRPFDLSTVIKLENLFIFNYYYPAAPTVPRLIWEYDLEGFVLNTSETPNIPLRLHYLADDEN